MFGVGAWETDFHYPFLSMATEKDEKSATWGKTPSVFPRQLSPIYAVCTARAQGPRIVRSCRCSYPAPRARHERTALAVVCPENGCWRGLPCFTLGNLRAKARSCNRGQQQKMRATDHTGSPLRGGRCPRGKSVRQCGWIATEASNKKCKNALLAEDVTLAKFQELCYNISVATLPREES